MPTPTGDCVTLSLQNAFSGRKCEIRDKEGSELDNLLSVGSKQALTTNIEYELVENQLANSLSAMKSKYICFSPKQVAKKNGLLLGNSNFHNGNGVKNGCTNGVKNAKFNPDSVLPQPKFVMFPSENVVLGWKSKGPTGAGMSNLGNTCYINSILQALFHVPAVFYFLSSDTEHRKKCEQENGPSCGDCLTCALAKTLLLSRSQDVIRPELITSKLRMICRSLNYGAEEDAHEFMRHLLENIESGYIKRFQQKKLDTYSRETTPVNQIFGGYLRQEVTCRNCGSVSTTFQHFQDLMLDIRKASKVEDALDQYFCKEVLDGPNAYRCEKCKQQSAATKKCSIERPPKVLCVQLKRFTGTGTKIMKSVELKQHISLQKYLNSASQYNSSTRYKLIAMVTHSGMSAGGGHYTAIAEVPNSSYYQFDDAQVRPIPLNIVMNTNAYILFFEMEPPRTVNGQREIQTDHKATPSTVTSNGSISSNGSAYQHNRWDRFTSPTQTAVQPRFIMHAKKVKSPLGEKVANRPEGEEAKNENRPGFIGPRLPTEGKPLSRVPEAPSSAPDNNDEDTPRKRLNDGIVKIPEEKKKAKVSSLVSYEEDSSDSERSPSPHASQSSSVKATTPHDWQVKHVASPSVSSEGSTKANWNVTSRSSPPLRKVHNCSNDSETELKSDKVLSLDRSMGEKWSEESGVDILPLSPTTLSRNSLQELSKKKNDMESENERIPKDSRSLSKNSSQNRSRTPHKNDEGISSHSSPWKNDGPSSYDGGPNRNHSFNRNTSSNGTSSSNGMGERSMHNGHSQTKNWSKDNSDTVSQLAKQSHTGLSSSVRSWTNEKSNLDRNSEEEDRLSRKRKGSDYDEDLDRGRPKKIRQHKDVPRNNHFNHFQQNRYMPNYYPRHNYKHYSGYNNKHRYHNSTPQIRNGMHRHASYKGF